MCMHRNTNTTGTTGNTGTTGTGTTRGVDTVGLVWIGTCPAAMSYIIHQIDKV